jgi:hypothetical protein
MLFLLKPHVTGHDGDVTSPDIVVDILSVDGTPRPLSQLTMQSWQQMADSSAQAAYAIMALGGGAVMLPAVVLHSGLVVVARSAWRLNNMDGHVNRVTLNGAPLSEIGLPEAMITAASGQGDALPRGLMLVKTAPGDTLEAVLDDPVKDRRLDHRVVVEPLGRDRWGDARPRPRYSVGPTQKDVKHFI